MKIRKRGRLTVGVGVKSKECPLIVLLGWENKRFRLDCARTESKDGWQIKVTTVKAWKISHDGLYTISDYYFKRRYIH